MSNSDQLKRAEEIEKGWMTARGKKELISHLKGNRLSASQAIKAKCYECCGGFDDGKVDCELISCPLHPYMPYNPKKSKRLVEYSPEARAAAGERMKNARANRGKESL